ncbi:MAG: hypothetical protein AB1585_15330 [Thermodesulfobacteriota bacterium]
MKAIHLTVDSKNRITLTKLIPEANISAVKAYTRDHRIILEPLVEIPAQEVWLFNNKTALKKVQKGLSQKGTIKRESFSKYVE